MSVILGHIRELAHSCEMVGDYPHYTDEVWDTERLWFAQHHSAICLCGFQYRRILLGLTLAHTRAWDGIRHVVLDSEYVFLGMHGAHLCPEKCHLLVRECRYP